MASNNRPGTSKLLAVGLVLMSLMFAAYLYGAYAGKRNLWPISTLRAVKAALTDQPEPSAVPASPLISEVDQYERLSAYSGKTAVPCPRPTDKTAVFLITGQSNAANYHGQRYRSAHGARIVNFFNGKCYVAASPLLGADYVYGEYWTDLSNRLLSAGAFDQIILVPAAVGGSRIDRWAPGGDLHSMVVGVLEELRRAQYTVTHVFWQQGESDWAEGTSASRYQDKFHAFVDTLRAGGVDAKVLVAISTKCLLIAPEVPDNPIAKAQASLADPAKGIAIGINTDSLLDDVDRIDGCHFSASGSEKAAAAWAELLLSQQ